ncbi:MAG: hypothetical protein ACYSVY_04415 [Planctomycetota bacterium]|jgi:hypothetical protein
MPIYDVDVRITGEWIEEVTADDVQSAKVKAVAQALQAWENNEVLTEVDETYVTIGDVEKLGKEVLAERSAR